MTSDAFVRHYTAVADTSPVPVLLYNVSMSAGVNLLPDAAERLATFSIRTSSAWKKSNADLVRLAGAIARSTETIFVVLGGSAPTFYHAVCRRRRQHLAIFGVVPDICVDS